MPHYIIKQSYLLFLSSANHQTIVINLQSEDKQTYPFL